MNPTTIEKLNSFINNVPYASSWRDSLAEFATIVRDEFVAQAPAVPPEQPAA